MSYFGWGSLEPCYAASAWRSQIWSHHWRIPNQEKFIGLHSVPIWSYQVAIRYEEHLCMSYATHMVGEWLTRVALLREATQGSSWAHKDYTGGTSSKHKVGNNSHNSVFFNFRNSLINFVWIITNTQEEAAQRWKGGIIITKHFPYCRVFSLVPFLPAGLTLLWWLTLSVSPNQSDINHNSPLTVNDKLSP